MGYTESIAVQIGIRAKDRAPPKPDTGTRGGGTVTDPTSVLKAAAE
ncbi:hypothetical protein ABZ901_10835 [Actinacidiphila alni]